MRNNIFSKGLLGLVAALLLLPLQGIGQDLSGREIMEKLEPYKVRPAPASMPGAYETGTQSHEGAAGVAACIDYFAWVGENIGQEYLDRFDHFTGRRQAVHAAMAGLFEYEAKLVDHLVTGLQQFDGVKILGISKPEAMRRRVPTVSFTVAGDSPDRIAQALADENIFVWSGHNYAVEAAAELGIMEQGGVRIGPVHYNTVEELDEFLSALTPILARRDAA